MVFFVRNVASAFAFFFAPACGKITGSNIGSRDARPSRVSLSESFVFYTALNSSHSHSHDSSGNIYVVATVENLAATKQSSKVYTHRTTRYLCSSVYWIKQIVTKAIFAFKEFWRRVVFININLIIKLLENELVFHLSNEHVVPLGVSRDIMNISNLSVIIVSRLALIVRRFPKNRKAYFSST